MFATSGLVAFGALLLSAAAQTSNPTVRAVFVFVNHGETTPSIVSEHVTLTPIGAQQMQRLGAAFRSRYLGGSASNTTSSNSTDAAPIQSISTSAIDNSQIAIMAGTEEWSTNSATAFMQGLYPPQPNTSNLAHNYVLNSNTTDYPLNGYQYAQVITYPDSDSNSIAIQGDQACTAWQNQMSQNLSSSPQVAQQVSQTDYFYTKLFSSAPLQGTLPPNQVNYLSADQINDFVNYNYAYNETMHNTLQNVNDTLTTLQDNAFTLERYKTSYAGNTDKNDPLNVLYSIAGRTLANKVTDQFSTFMSTSGSRGSLTLMFGSLRPMMAFFGVGGLMTQENLASGPLSQLPKPGSAMVFELVGGSDSSTNTDELQVRFWYRPSADAGDQFTTYPLFGSGFGGAAMSYTTFLQGMNAISKTPSQWCTICSPSTTSTFCLNQTITNGQTGNGNSSSISPAVAGVLGALLMAVLVSCIIAAFMAFGGWRFSRNSKNNDGTTGPAAVGGFKGNDRMASDADMTVSGTGRREERVGSWELRNGGKETQVDAMGAGIVTSEFAHRTRTMDDDGVSVTGAPVNVRESV